jgi:hypothetical protein
VTSLHEGTRLTVFLNLSGQAEAPQSEQCGFS